MPTILSHTHRGATAGLPRLGLVRCAVLLLLVLDVAWPQGEALADEALTGKLLAAAPGMPDPNFAGTIIYIAQHDDTGAMGVVINKIVGQGPVVDLLRALGLPTKGVKGDIDIHYGGPVGPKQGFILHTPDYKSQSSIPVNKDFTLSSDPSVLLDIGLGSGPRQSLFAFGYAGWAPGQLEVELERDAWVTLSADPSFVFGGDVENKWRQAVAREELEL